MAVDHSDDPESDTSSAFQEMSEEVQNERMHDVHFFITRIFRF